MAKRKQKVNIPHERTAVVHARLTEDEATAVEAAAEEAGLSKSAFLRLALLATCRRLDLPVGGADRAGVELAADVLRVLTPAPERSKATRGHRRRLLLKLAELLLAESCFGNPDPMVAALLRASRRAGIA
ncbi:hypothetical protein JYT15_00015 [Acidimicrobium ferrooxidans]|nr:hypothetical protein [Acidimicrobium ferrooxidans]